MRRVTVPKIDTTVRRWCEVCGRFTRSAMDAWGNEICAEHQEPDEEEEW
jgi:hypothetical protein